MLHLKMPKKKILKVLLKIINQLLEISDDYISH